MYQEVVSYVAASVLHVLFYSITVHLVQLVLFIITTQPLKFTDALQCVHQELSTPVEHVSRVSVLVSLAQLLSQLVSLV